MNIFGEKLYNLRKAKKMSQEELAIAIGTTKSTISKYEHGQIEPTLGVALKVAEYFAVSIDYLAGRKTELSHFGEYSEVVNVAIENDIGAQKILKALNLILSIKKG